jgi:hypothetical protein
MAKPTAAEIRAILESYGIIDSVLSDSWIENCRDNEVIPHVKDITRMTFEGEAETTEYYNGNGHSVLILNRRPVVELVSIETVGAIVVGNLVNATELIPAEGMIKARTNYKEAVYGPIFPKGDKNIKVTYKYGYVDYPNDVKRAVALLVAAKSLALVGARTGGGSLTVQSHSRNYGPGGKYSDIRKELIASGYGLLKKYMTSVTGG